MKNEILEIAVKALATEAAYTAVEVKAALDFVSRKNRWTHPVGTFDKAKRFYAAERTRAVVNARGPSRAYPYPEMTAARTADHCAEVHGADDVTHVRRIAMAYERLIAGKPVDEVKKLLKTGIKARREAAAEARELEAA